MDFTFQSRNKAYKKQCKQEAQLSQKDRATFRVIEYFAKWLKSLKVIRKDTVEYRACVSPY